MRLRLFTCAVAILAAACGPEKETTSPVVVPDAGASGGGGGAGGAGGTGGTGGSAGAGGTASMPIIDPHLFDCTAAKIPDRVDSVPVACETDPLCMIRLVSGHRGAGGQLGVIAPEDTLAGVRAGIALGVDFVETDPRPTKDGVLVNCHDTTVDRTTDGHGEVAKMTFEEIEQLHVDSSQFPGDFSCERIPTIEQLLATANGRVHVLLDGNKSNRVDLFIDAIHASGSLEWAIYDTSNVDDIDTAIALEPNLRTMIRVVSIDDLNTQLAHFSAHPPVIVEVDSESLTQSEADDLVAAVHAAKNRAMTDVFFTDFAAGKDGEFSLYQTYLQQGYDILESDRPDLVLRAIGRWPP